uniref:Uncharacterized protein n=1 Tax=Arion vulgaris TaxID=1028688 RepID=A0A0B7AA41_9EUPU
MKPHNTLLKTILEEMLEDKRTSWRYNWERNIRKWTSNSLVECTIAETELGEPLQPIFDAETST